MSDKLEEMENTIKSLERDLTIMIKRNEKLFNERNVYLNYIMSLGDDCKEIIDKTRKQYS